MRTITISIIVACSLFSGITMAEARSCSDVLKACLKTYDVTRGKQGAMIDPATICRTDYDGCVATGVWAGKTVTYKGLEKK